MRRSRGARELTARRWRRLVAVLRGPEWARVALLRRVAAGALALLAVVLLVAPSDPDRVPVLVSGRDLAPGVALTPADVVVRSWPAALVPAGSLRAVADADGRTPAGAVRAGEVLTDLRLVSPQLVVRAGGPDAAAVPLRPSDPAVAALLVPGSVVDVVAPGEGGPGDSSAARVVAERATVLSVLAEPSGSVGRGTGGGVASGRAGDGPLVLVALPRDVATAVAAASLAGDLAVTLR